MPRDAKLSLSTTRDSVPPSSVGNPRIELIDALRGTVLGGILLLHAIEHWGLEVYPEHSPAWLHTLDRWTDFAGFHLFAGKAYGIFALLFGISFFLILDRWSRRNIPFRGRFLWRLSVLAIFGYLHGIIYWCDVLLIIAIVAVPLVFLNELGNRPLRWIAALLLLRIPSLWTASRVLIDQGYIPAPPHHLVFSDGLSSAYANGNFLTVISANLWQGQLARFLWSADTDRYTQMLGLFICGLLLGRSRILENPTRRFQAAKTTLAFSALGVLIVSSVTAYLHHSSLQGSRHDAVENLLLTFGSLAQMAVWTSGVVVLFRWKGAADALCLLAPCGRTSLTCYVAQAFVGVPLFYGFGLGLYRHLGPFYSMLVGVLMFAGQCLAARVWLNYFTYGPLEWLWRTVTFGSVSVPFRKRRTVVWEPHRALDPNVN